MSAKSDAADEVDRSATAEPGEKAGEQASAGPADPTPVEPVEKVRTGRSPFQVSRSVAIVVAGLLVVVSVAAILFGVLLVRRAATERAGNEALATARAYAVTVTSYDYQNLDRDFANVLDGATGDFKDQFAGASQTLRPLIIQAKASGKGTVLDAGVKSASSDQVEVVLFANVQITGDNSPQPRTERDRVSMTMTRVEDRWLVSKMEVS